MKDDTELLRTITSIIVNATGILPTAEIIAAVRAHDSQPEYGPAMLTTGNPPEGAKVEAEGVDYTVYRMPAGPEVLRYFYDDQVWFSKDTAIQQAEGRPVYELIRGKQVSP